MASAYNAGPSTLGDWRRGTKDPRALAPGTKAYVQALFPEWAPGKTLIAPGYPGGPPLAPAQTSLPPPTKVAAPPPRAQGLLSDPNAPAVFTHQTPWGDVWPLLPAPWQRGPKR